MLTVMFASHNGQAVLPRMLASLAAAHQPKGGWKLVAIDNASSDDTAPIINSFADRLPLTLLHEGTPGKNNALNRGLSHAEGDFYVFCDDDVVVAQDWLTLWDQISRSHPGYDLFGGVTQPLWPTEPPNWILRDVDHGVVFAINPEMREGPCDAVALFGTNMAIRAQAFAPDARFDGRIGPSTSRTYPMGSETELVCRLERKGHRAWFCEGPKVQHIIRLQQMERASMLLRGYRWGRGKAHMGQAHHFAPARLARKNILRRALYPLLMHFYDPQEAWARQWEWAVDQGFEDGLRESRNLAPRWIRGRSQPHIAARFLHTIG